MVEWQLLCSTCSPKQVLQAHAVLQLTAISDETAVNQFIQANGELPPVTAGRGPAAACMHGSLPHSAIRLEQNAA